MNATWWAIALSLVATVFSALAALFLKLGAKTFRLEWSISLFTKNLTIIVSMFFYFTASLLGVIALKGGDLSALYPLSALGYIWTAALAVAVLKEKMSLRKYAAILLIVIGIVIIALGS
jgi:uncharacterized membrane protein